MQDELKRFSQAILNGVQGAGPGAGIQGVSSELNLALGNQSRDGLYRAADASGARAGTLATAEREAAEIARKKKMQELQDRMDPSKYERRRKADGGFAFFDPTGKEIGIDRYADVTGMRHADILKDSMNPLDLQYVNDFQNLDSVMKASFDGDEATVNATLKKSGLPAGTKPQQYMDELIKRYPHIYGRGSYQQSLRNLNNPVFRIPTREDSLAAQYGVEMP